MKKPIDHPITLSVLMPVYNERFFIAEIVRRVLAFQHPMVGALELIIVDDGSTDGTREIAAGLAAEHDVVELVAQPENRGKGAALRAAIERASGELSVVQDADLEYNPEDWARLLEPFVEGGADAVYGSRFMTSDFRRVLYYRHSLGNQLLTTLSNLTTDLNLTDMETCYKMVRTALLKSIPLRSDDFSVEPELTAKLAKRGAIIYEVPISYAGRTYREGKKITWRHGLTALAAIARYYVVDDLYRDDAYGAHILNRMAGVQRFNRWLAEFVEPDVGRRVLEVGAGIGNLTIELTPRENYLATDINPDHLAYLQNLALGKPYLEVQPLDVADRAAFAALEGRFDTAICINLLEHVEDEAAALENLKRALAPGGKAIVLVPQGPWLFSSLDEVVGHVRRYTRESLQAAISRAGLELVSLRDYNKIGVPGWLVNGSLLRRRKFSLVQLKVLNTLTPLLKRVDARYPWPGLSLVAVAQKPA